MLLDWPEDFDRWLTAVEQAGGPVEEITLTLLAELARLDGEPVAETATFKRVRQAKRHRLWRIAHPYEPDIAIRILFWFESDRLIVALVGFNKAKLGDVWYPAPSSEQKPSSTSGGAPTPTAQKEQHDELDQCQQPAGGHHGRRLRPRQRPVVADARQARMQEAVVARRARLRDADRAHAMGLAALRKAAELTQTELATALGISQAAVAKTEQREDLLLSTLIAYIEALGGQAHIVISFNGEEIDLDLGALHRKPTPA